MSLLTASLDFASPPKMYALPPTTLREWDERGMGGTAIFCHVPCNVWRGDFMAGIDGRDCGRDWRRSVVRRFKAANDSMALASVGSGRGKKVSLVVAEGWETAPVVFVGVPPRGGREITGMTSVRVRDRNPGEFIYDAGRSQKDVYYHL
jgi:hypothetical protein